MKMPKNWNRLTLNEQESWLVKKYQEMLTEVDSVTKMLAKIRGGQRIKIADEISRPFPKRPTLGCGVVLDGGRIAIFVPMPLGSKIVRLPSKK